MTEERFIKLTQRDNRSIWINARFIVTIEPKDGGALVVPMGDGMDYEVRESAETVVSLCAGEVVAAPKPGDAQRRQQQSTQRQPQQQGAQKQADRPPVQKPESRQPPPAQNPTAKMAAEGEKAAAAAVAPVEKKPVEVAAAPAVSEAKPAEEGSVAAGSASEAETAPAIAVSPAPAEEAAASAETPAKPAKKTRTRTARTKKTAPASAAAGAPSADAEAVAKPGVAQSEDEILAKAAKLGCRSRTRLMNTLKSQFGKTEDAAAALVAAWAEKGELSIDGNGHVDWKNRKGVAE